MFNLVIVETSWSSRIRYILLSIYHILNLSFIQIYLLKNAVCGTFCVLWYENMCDVVLLCFGFVVCFLTIRLWCGNGITFRTICMSIKCTHIIFLAAFMGTRMFQSRHCYIHVPSSCVFFSTLGNRRDTVVSSHQHDKLENHIKSDTILSLDIWDYAW